MIKLLKQIQIIFKSISTKQKLYSNLYLSLTLLSLKLLQEAIECIELADKRSPNNPLVYLERARILTIISLFNFEQNQCKSRKMLSEFIIKQLIKLDITKIFQFPKQNFYLKFNLEQFLFKMNRFDEAINTIDEAIAQDPFNFNFQLFKVNLLLINKSIFNLQFH